MFKINLILSIFLLISIIITVQSKDSVNNHHNNESTSFLSLNLNENKQRIGFEPFFYATNMFIDHFFEPSIPKEFDNLNSTEQMNEKFAELISSNNEKIIEMAKIPFKVYPSLVTFTIICLVTVFILPIIGFLLCCYRCCCKSSKFNPYDRKIDSPLRKINAFFMFIILTAILLTTITLFFTNQNSFTAIQMQNKTLEFKDGIHSFRKEKIPLIASKIKVLLNQTLDKLTDVLDESLYNFSKVYIQSKLKNGEELIQINNKIKVLKNNLTANESKELIEIFRPFLKAKQQEMINAFYKKLDEKDVVENLENELEKSTFDPKILRKEIEKGINQLNIIDTIINRFDDSKFKMIDDNLNKIDQIEHYKKYYSFFFMGLMGVCLFILFLFVLFSSGLSGVCARRKHKNIKQTCHRGVSANFLMSGVVFYFLFSWLLVLIAITIFVPGILIRQFACKPLIELDNNKLFDKIVKQKLASDYNFKNFNFSKALSECDKSGKSQEINAQVLDQININQILQTNLEPILNKASENILVLAKKNEELAFGKILDLNELKQKEEKIDQSTQDLIEISNIDTQNNMELKSLMSNMIEYLQLIKQSIDMLKEDSNNLKKQTTQDTKIEMELKNEISRIIPKVSNMLKSSTIELIESLDCKIISNLYKEIIVTGCYEYLDNINAFWLVLLVTLFLFFILSFFSMCQSDLFRKSYPYEKITNESQPSDSKNFYPNLTSNETIHHYHHLAKNPSMLQDNLNHPINAFEMENYSNQEFVNNNKSNDLQKPLNRYITPPPQYNDS